MPIRPERAALYPGGSIRSKEWRAFRASILERAGHACEGTDHFPACRAANGQPHPETGSKVVLTIAHMDHDETHADPARCRALCQRCHNAWDLPYRRENARRKTRERYAQVELEDFIAALPPVGKDRSGGSISGEGDFEMTAEGRRNDEIVSNRGGPKATPPEGATTATPLEGIEDAQSAR